MHRSTILFHFFPSIILVMVAIHSPKVTGQNGNPDEPLFRKAETWLDGLELDPIYLRERFDMKGIKHFVEKVNGYLDLYRFYTGETDRQRVREKVAEMYRVIENPAYHAFIEDASIARFRQDVISYLNACVLMREFGLDDSVYRNRIPEVLPRLHRDFPRRGANQKMAIVLLLEKLGYPMESSPEDFLDSSVLRRRSLITRLDVIDQYSLSHEIFMLTDYGRRKPRLSGDDRMYLLRAIPALLNEAMQRRDIDMLAEWVVAMCYLEMRDHPSMESAISLIRRSQNPDGSWGAYEGLRYQIDIRADIEYDLDVGRYLHTTEVALWALVTYRETLNGN